MHYNNPNYSCAITNSGMGKSLVLILIKNTNTGSSNNRIIRKVQELKIIRAITRRNKENVHVCNEMVQTRHLQSSGTLS